MRIRIVIVMLAALFGAACGGVLPTTLSADPSVSAAVGDPQDDERDLAERDELRKSVELAPGTRVEVTSINGTVSAETSSGSVAEIYIVRSARTRDALAHRRIFVEQTGGVLKIRGEEERGRTPDVRQRVMLKLPRSISLVVRGVNGRVAVGEIDGTVEVSGINGAVDVAHAMSISEISGVNGRVRISLVRLSDSGLRISGVNGKVELRFAEAINADISVTGINGNVFNEGSAITVIGKMNPSSFRGKIGSGGPAINVSGVNGNVDLRTEGSGE
jgi:hypothetical protein